MDWISHIIFGLTVTRLAFISRPVLWNKYRTSIILTATTASLFPDLDILAVHRSVLHAPLVLLSMAVIIGLKYPRFFLPILAGLWSHCSLDIFLFDNSRGTIQNVIDLIIMNDTAASRLNEAVTAKISAEGIMLFFPLSRTMYCILLTEKTYSAMMAAVLCTAASALLLTKRRPDILHQ